MDDLELDFNYLMRGSLHWFCLLLILVHASIFTMLLANMLPIDASKFSMI